MVSVKSMLVLNDDSWLMSVCCVLSIQRLCDYVCDLLLEESNVQPVSTPVTVCGDIHGQVRSRSSLCPPDGAAHPAVHRGLLCA